jgi:hypothetical protein
MTLVSFTDRHLPPRAPAGPTVPVGVRETLLAWFTNQSINPDRIWAEFLGGRLYTLKELVEDIADRLGDKEAKAFQDSTFQLPHARTGNPLSSSVAEPLLLALPTPFFLDFLEHAVAASRLQKAAAITEINRCFELRGVWFRFEWTGLAVWHGDPGTYEQVLVPAITALRDARLAAAGQEFGDALAGLRQADRVGDKNAVRDASNAVESTMKALLDNRGITRGGTETAVQLWDALHAGDVVARGTKEQVCGPSQLRNRYGGHGADPANPDAVPTGIPALAVHGAASSISYLASLLT